MKVEILREKFCSENIDTRKEMDKSDIEKVDTKDLVNLRNKLIGENENGIEVEKNPKNSQLKLKNPNLQEQMYRGGTENKVKNRGGPEGGGLISQF